jgi:hypothetical protein
MKWIFQCFPPSPVAAQDKLTKTVRPKTKICNMGRYYYYYPPTKTIDGPFIHKPNTFSFSVREEKIILLSF